MSLPNKMNQYNLTVISNINKQIGVYIKATTSHFTKQLLEYKIEDDLNNPFIVSKTTQEINLNDYTISEFSVESNLDNLDNDIFVEFNNNNFNRIRRRSQYKYNLFTEPGIVYSTLSMNTKKRVQDVIEKMAKNLNNNKKDLILEAFKSM
ncbi:hypothetical protein C2G38_2195871 [Gigaspora rosea]|uniref:Uncharacterized protein n=1 Tax=Gigaspora rosea TaxID=44941 RepID=A0A397UV71_9GLOM|nr:hypothetical protein C2G38_2195871 [Gigaspora rosea]